MEPTFTDGELVLIEPVGVRRFGAAGSAISVGDAIVARHPFKNLDVIKFVGTVHDDGYLTLESPGGDDSRQFGRVRIDAVRGRVTSSLSKVSLFGLSGVVRGTMPR